MKTNLFNLILFQAGWWGIVLSTHYDLYFLPLLVLVVVLAIHLAITKDRWMELTAVLLVGTYGYIVDSLLTFLGIFDPKPWMVPEFLCPLWLFVLWLNLGIIFRHSIKWLDGRYYVAAICGAIGGPMAYYGGEVLDVLRLGQPLLLSIGVLALVWGITTPLLLHICNNGLFKSPAQEANSTAN